MFDPALLPLLLAWFVAFVFSTTLHEAGHAYAALRLGDATAYRGGQVSLNPLPHIRREPIGMVVVPIASFLLMGGNWMIGWASAPYDPRWAQRFPRRSALMAAAGPLANLGLVIAAGISMRIGLVTGYFTPPSSLGFAQLVGASDAAASAPTATLLSILFTLNLVLFVFNLLPLPPLDGSGVIQLAMSHDLARRYQLLIANPMWAWVGIVAAWRFFPAVFSPVYRTALGLLFAGA